MIQQSTDRTQRDLTTLERRWCETSEGPWTMTPLAYGENLSKVYGVRVE